MWPKGGVNKGNPSVFNIMGVHLSYDEHRTTRICKSYDQIADEYVRRIFHELDAKPLDQELVNRFARQLRGRGEVCDMGCGPGHVAQYLKNLGANVFGLDISPAMLEQARRLNPDILFREGDMLALDLPDSKLAGIVAFYAIVNTPKELLSDIFRQMFKVLQAGGMLLLAFHIGDEVAHYEELWERPVDLDFFYFQPADIRRLLEAVGFTIEEVIEREPYAPNVEHQSRRAYIFARR